MLVVMVAFIVCGLVGVMLPLLILSFRGPNMKGNASLKQTAMTFTSAVTATRTPGKGHPLDNPIMYGTAWKKERTTELVVAAVEAG